MGRSKAKSDDMYVRAALPEPFKDMGSLAFAEKLIRETGIAVAPGVGFGDGGEAIFPHGAGDP